MSDTPDVEIDEAPPEPALRNICDVCQDGVETNSDGFWIGHESQSTMCPARVGDHLVNGLTYA